MEFAETAAAAEGLGGPARKCQEALSAIRPLLLEHGPPDSKTRAAESMLNLGYKLGRKAGE